MNLFTAGFLDPQQQYYKCLINDDIETLLEHTKGRPFINWKDSGFGSESQAQLEEPEANSALGLSVTLELDPCRIETWFPNDQRIALFGNLDQPGMSYAELQKEIKACPTYYSPTNEPVNVALLLPRSLQAETAVALLALLAQANICVCPLDFNMPLSKLIDSLHRMSCKGIVTTQEKWNNFQYKQDLLQANFQDVRLIQSKGTKAGALKWRVLRQQTSLDGGETKKQTDHYQADVKGKMSWPRLMLLTSGTTAGPKLVALTLTHLLHSATCLAVGLQLEQKDVSCCAMPLYHIGGIAGAWLCVLVSGSAVVMMQGPFDPQGFLDRLNPALSKSSTPTWYYAAPTMHQALLLACKMSGNRMPPNCLRLIRSAAAHLPHKAARELAETFQTKVYPTYGMTEAMPVCIPSPKDAIVAPTLHASMIVDSVGQPAGCTLAIINTTTGRPVSYGEIGEVAVGGPGVIRSYMGLSISETHTKDGLLKTGDMGYLDHEGRLYIKGRSKEMIKRGGEQVWPNEIDQIVQVILGVEAAVTFAVPNELWGEEVAVAVVLERNYRNQEASVRECILNACRSKLDRSALPCQIIFLDSIKDIPKGPTGKYLRARMADHLGAKSVDTTAMRAFQSVQEIRHEDIYKNSKNSKSFSTVNPSPSLNGVRFLTACFVVNMHVGQYQSMPLTKMQSFSLSMPIFFFLLGFQTTCNLHADVSSTWSSYVGTKIGSMHAAFVAAMCLAYPVFLLWECGPTGYWEEFEDESCWENGEFLDKGVWWLGHTLTGLVGHRDRICGDTWFQSVAYEFLIIIPFLDSFIRRLSNRQVLFWFVTMIIFSMVWPAYLLWVHSDYQFIIVSWIPHLVASVLAGHIFKRFPPLTQKTPTDKVAFFRNADWWARVSDSISIFFLILYLANGFFSRNCMWVEDDVLETFRADEVSSEDQVSYDGDPAQWVCDITWDEFAKYIRTDYESWVSLGRFQTTLVDFIAGSRIGSPFAIVWLYGIAFGKGRTAKLFGCSVLQALAPISYLVYLLHVTVSRLYWYLTRGMVAEEWWRIVSDYPMPVAFHETIVILVATIVLGNLIDRYVLPHLMPLTVRLGVTICHILASPCAPADTGGDISSKYPQSSMSQIISLVKSLSGIEVTQSSRLIELGLDSLGITAFLGNLRAKVPAARGLTVQKISNFDTVGELVDYIDGKDTCGSCERSASGVGDAENDINTDEFETESVSVPSNGIKAKKGPLQTLRSRSELPNVSTFYHQLPTDDVDV